MKELAFYHCEFERDVRQLAGRPNGPVTAQDVIAIKELDCSNYTFMAEDLDTLCEFKNLETLYIEIFVRNLDFLSAFSNLKVLRLVCGWDVNFNAFATLKHLQDLCVSGGDMSSIDMLNIEILEQLPKLTALTLHEFGTVDLKFLERMPNLTVFYCGYADGVTNIASIGSLRKLKSLVLIGIEMDNLDFLDGLPDSLSLELCGDEVHDGINEEKFHRFRDIDVCEMTVNREQLSLEILRQDK